MTKTAHTPGSWVLVKHDRSRALGNEGTFDRIGPIHVDWEGVVDDCWLKCPEADARLIAAAPDMLEALETALTMLDALKVESGRGIEWDEEDAFRMGERFDAKELDAMKNMRAVLTKAKGGDA